MKSERAGIVADASLEVLAAKGMRGLTHRAVDDAAGLAHGSTSNLARTREALLELALTRLAEIEADRFAAFSAEEVGRGPAALAEYAAVSIHLLLNEHRVITQARYEMALEATRNPRLREIYDAVGVLPRRFTADLLAAAGFTDARRRGAVLVSMIEGVMFDAIAGAGTEPTVDSLRLLFGDVLEGMWRRDRLSCA